MPRNRKPFRHKWPKGWRPQMWRGVDQGPAKEFYEGAHPSVVRDRSPEIKGVLAVGKSLGHTHAVFKAHPNCCPLCQAHDGRRQLLGTVLSWKYPLPHPNCWCRWETEKVVRKADMLANSPLLDTSKIQKRIHVLSKARSREHLILRYGPSGKKRWMKTGEAGGAVSKKQETPVQDEKKKSKRTFDDSVHAYIEKKYGSEAVNTLKGIKEKRDAEGADIHDEAKEELNDAVDDLRQIKPGEEGEVRGHTVERHKDGNRFRVGGVVTHGFKATAFVMMGIERVSASYGQWMGGTIGPGAEMAQGGQATRDVQAVGAKTTNLAEKAAEKIRERRERQASKLKRRRDKKGSQDDK